jgi:PKD domain-containing protein
VTSTGGVTYDWSPASYLSDATIAQPAFTGTSYPGTYTYTLNSINGSCSATDQVSVTVRAYPAVFTVANGAIATFTAVNAGVGASYLWNFGSGSSPATAAGIGPFNVSYRTAGIKTASLTVTDGNSCTSTESLSFAAIGIILPLQLLSFTAQATGDNVALNWETADALNVASFDIERSADRNNFVKVGSVAFSSVTANYHFTDVNVPASSHPYFYRLSTFDTDGSHNYSAVLAISLAGTSLQITVSPNPFTNLLKLTMHLESNETSLSIKLLTIQGAVIAEQEFAGLTEGSQTIRFYVPGNISAGIYILRVKPENSIPYYIKLMK